MTRAGIGKQGRTGLRAWSTAAVLMALTAGAAAALWSWSAARAARATLEVRIARIQPAPAGARTATCAEWKAGQPLVLLVLGQSNAANHGERGLPPAPVRLVHGGACLWATDPLPGGTGDGSSIWARLPARLAQQLPTPWRERPVVLAVLAVDATLLRDWVDAGSPLRALLLRTAKDLTAIGLAPSMVLWQQGEADARADTSPAQLTQGLRDLAGLLDQAGIGAPWMLASSTRCRGSPHDGVRGAVRQLGEDGRRFVHGPDTDQLDGVTMRRDGCHFSTMGLDAAANLWASALAAYFAGR